jgi:hypothetical protein
MKLLTKGIFFIFCCLLFSCQNQPDIPFIDFKKQFGKAKTTKFSLFDVLQIDAKWDKVVFLPPYFRESFLYPLEINNSWQLESKIMGNSMDEGLITVVFLENNRAIAFSKVRRRLIDFLELTNKIKFRLLTKNESKKVFILRQDEKEWAKFKILK